MGGPAAEQIIAGVVLSERLAVTMYGAIHRAQWNGQRNLRALVVDSKLLDEKGFRDALTDTAGIATAIALQHANIVPTAAVESEGPHVVVVTRGGGRYVTVQDLIASARTSKGAGKLSLHVAGTIGKAVVEALAAAHNAGIVHGAVHPRSVLVDEDGAVRITDWVVGRALTTAVAAGADSALWRGLAGFIAPELVVGEDPTPAADVFAVGAMLFTMLAGEVPPGALHVTPAVERLVQRALDTDVTRRYKNALDLLENMLEAFEDDRWELAERGELIKAAGLSSSDANIDDATEDLLASLGQATGEVQTPIRPSVDFRAEAAAARAVKTPTNVAPGKRLDDLLANLTEDHREEGSAFTNVDARPFKRDPISELIQGDPRKAEAIVQVKAARSSSDSGVGAAAPRRSVSQDEASALDALAGLDAPMRRVSTAAEAATVAAAKLEAAAVRAEAAAVRVETGSHRPAPPASSDDESGVVVVRATPKPAPVQPARTTPIVDPIDSMDAPAVNLRGPGHYIVAVLAIGAVLGAGYAIYRVYQGQQASMADNKRQREEDQKKADERTRLATAQLADPGSIEVRSTPNDAGVWLRLGPTPVDTEIRLSAAMTHELALVMPGHDVAEVQVIGADWAGDKEAIERTATAKATLVAHDATKKPPAPVDIPMQPTAENKATGVNGSGPLHVDSTPAGADAWVYIGHTDEVRLTDITAGRPYELVVVKDGFAPAHIAIRADDWRDNDPKTPIDQAKKKLVLQRSVDLAPLPGTKKSEK